MKDKECKTCASYYSAKSRCVDKNSGIGYVKPMHSCEWWKPIFKGAKPDPEDGFIE